MQARKDDGFALLIVYIAALRPMNKFSGNTAPFRKIFENRQRAIFRQQRHFPTQDFGGFGAFYDGGNGRISKLKQIGDE